ncbi:hypothetical protein Sjap_010800 [Stephania japonica]|uniref:Trimethylguanosine synthase n=1 Tax=Stephania japonica TaxID=461633 RepID=A0AAP0P4H2_9MAGN
MCVIKVLNIVITVCCMLFRRCKVVAIDIDPRKIDLALNNAKIYGVDSQIDFVVGDFLQHAPSLKMWCFFHPLGEAHLRKILRCSH